MTGQADWYLHEGPRPEFSDTEFLSLSGGGIVWAQCGIPDITLDAISIWPTLQPGDYLLVQAMCEDVSLDAFLPIIPDTWDYIFHKMRGVGGEGGPNCHWAGRVVTEDELSSSWIFSHEYADYRACISVWALRGVDKRGPVDNIFLTAQETYDGPPSKPGQWVYATRVHDYGGVQVTSLGVRDGADHASDTWYLPVMLGPEPDHSYKWSMQSTFHPYAGVRPWGPGYNSYITNLVYFDIPQESDFEELTKTPPRGSSTGGFRYFTELNGSISWYSTTTNGSWLKIFGGSAGSLTRVYVKTMPALPPGQYMFFGQFTGYTYQSSWGSMRVICDDEPSLNWGALGDGLYAYYGMPAASSLSFDYVVFQNLHPDGVPNRVMGDFGCVFSLTQTHDVRLLVEQLGDPSTLPGSKNDDRNGGNLGLNRTNKSVFTPYIVPRVDYPGINRAWAGIVQWSPFESKNEFYGLTFQINKRGTRRNVPGFAGNGLNWGHGHTWASAYPVTLTHRLQDEQGVALVDRWLFPRYFVSASATAMTWGHYYWEFRVQMRQTVGYEYDIARCGLTDPAARYDGHSLFPRYLQLDTSESAGAQNSITHLYESLSSAPSATYWYEGLVAGVEVDFENSVINYYRAGSRIAQWSITALGRRVPVTFWLQTGSFTGTRTHQVSCNFTGPFYYTKPTGAVAFDWMNEVSL